MTTTAALVVGLVAVAGVHRAPRELRLTSTAQTVTTRAQQVRLVCPPAPRLQADSSDPRFDAGRGIGWSRVDGAAVGVTTTSFGSATLPVARPQGRPGSASPAPSSATPGSSAGGGAEVPRPSSSTTSPTARPSPPVTQGLRRGYLALVDRSGTASTMMVAEPAAGTAAQVGGLATTVSASGDLRGISAAACTAGTQDTWLVGGRSGSGVGSRVVLSNPSDAPATVDLRLLTPTGTTTPRAGGGIVIAPRSTQEVLLRSLTSSEGTLAVGVSSTGTPVAAFLVDQRVSGTTPAGVDVVSGAEPARRVVLMGRTDSGEDATLRVAVPGTAAANLAYRIEDADGAYGSPQALTVAGGTSVDVPLPDGPDAATRVVVESDQPVVAGLELSRRAGGVVDRTWVAGSAGLRTPVVIPVPRRPGLSVGLVVSAADASGAGALTVQRRDALGRPQPDLHITVPAGGVVQVPPVALGTAATVVLRPTGRVYASLDLSATGGDGRRTMMSSVSVPAAAASRVDTQVQHAAPGDLP